MSFDIIIDWKEFKTTFQNHEITMELRPLKRWASLLLTPIGKEARDAAIKAKNRKAQLYNEISGSNPHMSEEEINQRVIATYKKEQSYSVTEDDINFVYKVQEKGEKVFPEHVRNIKGLSVNGAPITNDILCQETVFGPLCISIISELMNRSQLTEQDEKNSAGPQPTRQILDETI